ncbi:MAG: MFS transporter [Dehalococcoidia bacterium]|nr:MFS transporter [Dehalococcoidia bacterium]
MEVSESLPIATGAEAIVRPRFLGIEALAALRHRDFRILWLGMLLSSSTIMFQWFAVGRLIESYFPRVLGENFPILLMLGIAGLTRGLGMFIFSIAGGVLADRFDRRNLAIFTQIAGMALSGSFALLIALDWIELWHVFVLLFAVAATQAFDMPARQALIPQLVERRDITNAVALFTVAMQTSFAFSPLLAGYLLDALGIAGTYAASITGHAVLLVALLFIRHKGRPDSRMHTGILAQVGDGIAYARHDTRVLGILAMSFVISSLSMSVIINLSPFWILRVLDVGPATWGLLAAVWGVGSVLTSYTLSGRGDFRHKGRMFLVSSLLFSGLFVLWGLVRSPVWFGTIQFFMAICMTTNFVTASAIIQNLVPDEVRGRVVSLFGLNQAIALTTGIAIGAVAEVGGATTVVPLLGVTQIALLSGLAVFTLPRLRHVH